MVYMRYIELDNIRQLDETIKRSPVCVLDFYADWCGPCKRLFAELTNYVKTDRNLNNRIESGEVCIIKINTDNFPKLSDDYKIESLPTVMIYREGKMLPYKFNTVSSIVKYIQ